MSNVADFGENLLNLAELQVRMSAMELRQNAQSLRSVAVLFLVGSILALASLPVVLAGVAELLVTELGFRRGHAFLAVGFAAFGLGALGAALAAVWFGRKELGFPLADEFTRNLNWRGPPSAAPASARLGLESRDRNSNSVSRIISSSISAASLDPVFGRVPVRAVALSIPVCERGMARHRICPSRIAKGAETLLLRGLPSLVTYRILEELIRWKQPTK